MSFKKYLLERMSPEEAKNIFNIEKIPTQDELKKLYYKLSLLNHPDKGGSTEKMQQINVAYDILKQHTGISGTGASKIDWEKIRKEYKELGKQIKDLLINNFNSEKFIEYLNNTTGLKFQFKILRAYPKETDYDPHNAGFSAEFSTEDNSTKFLFELSANLTSIKYASDKKILTGTDTEDISFDLIIITQVFHNNKTHKLSQKNYTFTNDHSFYKDPSKLFPADKVKRIISGATSKREFSKRDMYAFLQNKLNAETSDQWAYIPIKEDYKLVIYRSVFFKTAAWMISGLYQGRKRINALVTKTYPETEIFAIELDKIIKNAKEVSTDKLVEYLNTELTKLSEQLKSTKTV